MAPLAAQLSDTNIAMGCSLALDIYVNFGVTCAMNIIIDPGCGRTTDPDIVFGSSPGLDVTMTSVGNAGHPN